MPAKSAKQERFMALCAHNPSKARGECPAPKVAREFSTMQKRSTKGSPAFTGAEIAQGFRRCP